MFKSLKNFKKKSSITKEILKLIKELYQIESYTRENNYSYQQIYELRQEKAKQILDKIKSILDEYVDDVPEPNIIPRTWEDVPK